MALKTAEWLLLVVGWGGGVGGWGVRAMQAGSLLQAVCTQGYVEAGSKHRRGSGSNNRLRATQPCTVLLCCQGCCAVSTSGSCAGCQAQPAGCLTGSRLR